MRFRKFVLSLIPAVLSSFIAHAQPAVKASDDYVANLKKKMSSAAVKKLNYRTPVEKRENSGDDNSEGGDFVENLDSFLSGDKVVLAILSSSGAYVERVDSVWYRLDPIYVSTSIKELATDDVVKSRIWLQDGKIIRWQECRAAIDEPCVHADVIAGHDEKIKEFAASFKHIKELIVKSTPPASGK